jgi:hypothetical protein
MKELTMKLPLALKNLIVANNELLRRYQEQLLLQIEQSSNEFLHSQGHNPSEWGLDLDALIYVNRDDESE